MMNYKFDKNTNKNFLKDKKIAIIIGYFYQDIGNKLLLGAQEILTKYGMNEKNLNIFYVPGAFEIPLLAKKLAKSAKYHGIVTLGAVINGETPHFDFVCNECSRGVADVGYQFEVPTTFGVLTTNNMKQAISRAGGDKGNKGKEATLAMIEMLYLLEQV